MKIFSIKLSLLHHYNPIIVWKPMSVFACIMSLTTASSHITYLISINPFEIYTANAIVVYIYGSIIFIDVNKIPFFWDSPSPTQNWKCQYVFLSRSWCLPSISGSGLGAPLYYSLFTIQSQVSANVWVLMGSVSMKRWWYPPSMVLKVLSSLPDILWNSC